MDGRFKDPFQPTKRWVAQPSLAHEGERLSAHTAQLSSAVALLTDTGWRWLYHLREERSSGCQSCQSGPAKSAQLRSEHTMGSAPSHTTPPVAERHASIPNNGRPADRHSQRSTQSADNTAPAMSNESSKSHTLHSTVHKNDQMNIDEIEESTKLVI
mgnify:CR=1 FL=1